MKLTASQFKQNFQYLLVDQRLSPDDRKSAIGFALARGISYTLDVPATKVTNARMYYLQQHQPVVQGLLSELVEHYAFPISATERIVEQLWTARYQLVHIADYAEDNTLASVAMTGTETTILTPRVRELYPCRELAYTAGCVAGILRGE